MKTSNLKFKEYFKKILKAESNYYNDDYNWDLWGEFNIILLNTKNEAEHDLQLNKNDKTKLIDLINDIRNKYKPSTVIY